jgi:hypothetical protein
VITLKIKCKCGKVLRVPEALAGRKVACPACKSAYRIPHEKFGLTAPPATPSRKAPVSVSAPAAAPAAVRAPKESPVDLDLPPIDPTATPSELNLLDGLDLPSPNLGPICPECNQPQPTGARICVQCGIDLATGKSVLEGKQVAPVNVGYAPGERSHRNRRRDKHDVAGEPTRGYWSDAMLSFVYPFRSPRNCITFAIIVVVACAVVLLRGFGFLSVAGLLGGALMLMCLVMALGWLAAVYLTIVQHTALGIEELPGVKIEDGPWDDFIKPGFKYAGAFLCAMCPAAAYSILAGTGLLPESMQSGVVFLLWLGAGIFVWPILVILFAFDALNMLWRVDLIITTIFRTFLPYLALWLMLLLAGSISIVPLMAPVLLDYGITLPLPDVEEWGLAGAAVLRAVDVYVMIVVMRQIGLYYLHFKRRFTLELS